MYIQCIAVTKKASPWVQQGIDHYLKYFTQEIRWHFNLIQPCIKNIPLSQRLEQEAQLISSRIQPAQLTIVLDERGRLWDTAYLATQLKNWLQQGQDINLVIGGADGLSPFLLKKHTLIWSLSPLTLPHQLVRLLVIEQFYRAWSILHHHPYHRGRNNY